MNGRNTAVEKLNDALRESVKAFGVADADNIYAEFDRPKHEGHGDRAANVAMRLARPLRMNPKDIAAKIAVNLNSDVIDRTEIAGPGFVNVFLSGKFYAEVISDILEQGMNYGSVNLGQGKKVQVEFVSANPTGPLHIGHGRGAAVGDSVARILKFTGWDVQREYYVNDSGLQIDTLGRSTQARYFELLNHESHFPENGYKGAYIYDLAQEIIDSEGRKFIDVPESESLNYFKKYAAEKIMSGIKADLEEFRVSFDKFFPEGYLHENGLVKSAMEDLKSRGYAYEHDGALWFKTEDTIGDDKDRVLIRANGIPTYFASDIAYHRNKFITREFERVIDVWGADHHGYIARVKAAIKAMGKNPDDFDVLLIQLVNLIREGKIVTMSTRAGEFITLRDVLDEAGVDATRFFFLMRRSDSQLDFDLDLAKKQGNENPVYYVQYAHARIAGVLREFQNRGGRLESINPSEIPESIFDDRNARDLADALSYYPEEIAQASRELAPQTVTGYVLNLAGIFHAFYNTNRILDEPDEKISLGRINLIMAAKIVIASCLNLLGVSSPERM
ncbi:MAG: arginine--tRNA ligase [Synergistaceae bacterium]|nr:arginine--tRNA ligase [Synergistaceae bacterium]